MKFELLAPSTNRKRDSQDIELKKKAEEQMSTVYCRSCYGKRGIAVRNCRGPSMSPPSESVSQLLSPYELKNGCKRKILVRGDG